MGKDIEPNFYKPTFISSSIFDYLNGNTYSVLLGVIKLLYKDSCFVNLNRQTSQCTSKCDFNI